jgi:hypothetical protein
MTSQSRPSRPRISTSTSDDDVLGLVAAATASELEPLSPAMEERLMGQFRASRGRVGVSTTGAGTQIVDLPDGPAEPAAKVARVIPWRTVAPVALAAAVLLALGARTVVSAPGGSAAGASTVAFGRAPSGALTVAVTSVPRTVWLFRVAADGRTTPLGRADLGEDRSVPASAVQGVERGAVVRVSSTPDGLSVVAEGPIP